MLESIVWLLRTSKREPAGTVLTTATGAGGEAGRSAGVRVGGGAGAAAGGVLGAASAGGGFDATGAGEVDVDAGSAAGAVPYCTLDT